ncbi:MAG: hypothetical protein HYZ08_00315, partial [Candidatus Kerfeldbacteria bacterium]|nr:hypothetical protein [Candidatus Kerfeldbacteria bacterium]
LHPDHRTLDGEVESITIDHVRELEHFLHQTSLSYRTVILNRPEHMTRAAGHALLKALEEPPLRTIFLLITARPDQLLLTIRSRVQHIRMYRVPQDTLRRSFPTTEKNQLQRASGRPGKLTESNPGWECPIEELFLSSPINVRRDLRKILSSKKSFQERKERVSRLVDQVEQVMRGVLLAHADLSHRNESSLPESTVTTLSHHYPLSTCRTILNRIERVRQGLELNLQPELACEYLFPSHQ